MVIIFIIATKKVQEATITPAGSVGLPSKLESCFSLL